MSLWILPGMDESHFYWDLEYWRSWRRGRKNEKNREKMKVSFAGDSDVICHLPAICVHFLDVLKILKQRVTAKRRLFLIGVKWKSMMFCLFGHCRWCSVKPHYFSRIKILVYLITLIDRLLLFIFWDTIAHWILFPLILFSSK